MHLDTFKKLELPFKLGEDEEALVGNPRSIFILGRSGTGKTTVMLSRMIHKELISVVSDIEEFTGNKGSQWLVTCNKLLRNASNSYYDKVKLSYPDLSNHLNPEFLTFHDVLFNINDRLETPFFSTKVSNYIYREEVETSEPTGGAFATVGNFHKDNEVTFISFKTLYFPKFSDNVKKAYSASVIFMEIQVYKLNINCSVFYQGFHSSSRFMRWAFDRKTISRYNQSFF
jgi:hypothetical protein